MNNVCLVARISTTPELRYTPNGKAVCNFSVASERKFKDADGKAIVDFIDCVAWGNQAEFLCKWFDKGVRIGLTGELQTRTFQDKDGNNRKVVEILVASVEFADGKREANTNTNTFATNTDTESAVDDFVPVTDEELPF